jgi:hypothetical protein
MTACVDVGTAHSVKELTPLYDEVDGNSMVIMGRA